MPFLEALKSLRPRQWTKNILVFAGIFFSQNLFHFRTLLTASAAFCIFCMISSGSYIFNDILDRESDRSHPEKRKRPIASGKIPVRFAAFLSAALSGCGLFLAFRLDRDFGLVCLAYLLLAASYSLGLKRVVILDLLVISAGFVLRAVAGALVLDVAISSWLLLCTTFLALFLGLNKRRHELLLLGKKARSHRPVLVQYSPALLEEMNAVVTASTVMAYALYTTSAETVAKFGTRNLIFTLPFVLYGIFRYQYLIHQRGMGGSPERVLLRDPAMIVNVFLYLAVVGFIIYSGAV